MESAVIIRIHVGGKFGVEHEQAGKPIPDFEPYVREQAANFLDGGTVYRGTGIWQGTLEPCMVIETLIMDGENVAHETAQYLALVLHLRDTLAQDSVLVTRTQVEAVFA